MRWCADARTARVRGVDINYEVHQPSGREREPTLVLLHGFGASLRTWDRVAPALGEAFPLLRIDLKGFGRSGRPRDDCYTVDENAEIVSELLARDRRSRVILIGHSYGGAVACMTSVKLRERGGPAVAGLVLIDSASYEQRLPFFVGGLRHPLTRWLGSLVSVETSTRFVLRTLVVDKTIVDAAMVERYAFPRRIPGSDYAAMRTAQQIEPEDFAGVTQTLQSIDVPTQIIWGDRDRAVPFAFASRLHRDIAGSRLAVVRGVGHMPHEERPGDVVRVLMDFFAGSVDGSRGDRHADSP